VFADYLTRQGIVVLRVDKRGIGKTTGAYRGSGIKEFASDALAGVAYLRSRPEVAAEQVGLIGHSEGGEVASVVAAGSRDVAYVVLLGSPGLSFYDLLVLQDGAQAKAEGKSDAEVELIRGFSRRFYTLVRRSTDASEIERGAQALYAALTEQEKQALDWPNLGGTLGLAWATAPGAREALEFDVGPSLRQIHCPVLALIGSKDCQVPPKENLSAIEDALKAAGNRDYAVRELPGLNHLFQTCTTGAVSEYDQIGENISPLVPHAVSEWILSHTRAAPASRK
jgi:pimeloyl-ACP methyl ester carboxylesterase